MFYFENLQRKCNYGIISALTRMCGFGRNMSEIKNLVFWWRVVKLERHATVTPCDEKAIFRLVCISI